MSEIVGHVLPNAAQQLNRIAGGRCLHCAGQVNGARQNHARARAHVLPRFYRGRLWWYDRFDSWEEAETMTEQISRRETLRAGLAASSLLALLPDWAVPALAQGETEVPFTDIPKNFDPGNPNARTRILDIRKIDGQLTPRDQFFAVNHFNRPEIDPATYRLKFTGMVNKLAEFPLAELRGMKSTELINGYECSGNSPRSVQGLSSCGRFRGVPLSALLKQVGVHARAREVVFFGTDRGKEDVVFRQQTFKIEQQFGRSITLENAMKPGPLIAYELNGE